MLLRRAQLRGCTAAATTSRLLRLQQQRAHLKRAAHVASQSAQIGGAAAPAQAAAQAAPHSTSRLFTVIGAGLAGLATAFHLLKLAPPGGAVHVTLVDAVGIGAGGSGAAAGLLHPFGPTGKLLWRAQDAMEAALELLQAAEAAAAAAAGEAHGGDDALQQQPADGSRIAWRTGMLRAAGNSKQSQNYWREHHQQQDDKARCQQDAGATRVRLSARVADMHTAQQLLPGVHLPVLLEDQHQQQEQQQQPEEAVRGQTAEQALRKQREQEQLSGWSPAAAAALHVPCGITLHPQRYMHAVWQACQQAAAARQDGSTAVLQLRQLRSLRELLVPAPHHNQQQQQQQQHQEGPPSAIIIAAGAAVGSLAEVGEQLLPLNLCQGYTLDLAPAAAGAAAAAAYPADAPSLLGIPYFASQGGQQLVVGATTRYDCTSQQALAELTREVIDPPAAAAVQGGSSSSGSGEEAAEVAAAAQELLSGAAAAWPPITLWRIAAVRSGVRAVPRRSHLGAMPLLGRLPQQSSSQQSVDDAELPAAWLLVGLGARGLVYHAWLGKLTAAAALAGSEACLPRELLAWKEKGLTQQHE